jgi:hypothetical protein
MATHVRGWPLIAQQPHILGSSTSNKDTGSASGTQCVVQQRCKRPKGVSYPSADKRRPIAGAHCAQDDIIARSSSRVQSHTPQVRRSCLLLLQAFSLVLSSLSVLRCQPLSARQRNTLRPKPSPEGAWSEKLRERELMCVEVTVLPWPCNTHRHCCHATRLRSTQTAAVAKAGLSSTPLCKVS